MPNFAFQPITDAEEESFASEEGEVTEYTTILHLRDVQMDMAGSYQCVISNQFGPAYSKRAVIVVHGKRQIWCCY